MINVIINDEIVDVVKNWDSALRICANFYKNGVNVENMKLVNGEGKQLPIQIRHLLVGFR